MEWSIENLGSLGEFVSSIAVVVTLMYLAIQTKQTQKMIRGQTRQSWAEATQDALLKFADSDHLPDIQQKLFAAGFPDSRPEHDRHAGVAGKHRIGVQPQVGNIIDL